jgi:hypothetical protein
MMDRVKSAVNGNGKFVAWALVLLGAIAVNVFVSVQAGNVSGARQDVEIAWIKQAVMEIRADVSMIKSRPPVWEIGAFEVRAIEGQPSAWLVSPRRDRDERFDPRAVRREP